MDLYPQKPSSPPTHPSQSPPPSLSLAQKIRQLSTRVLILVHIPAILLGIAIGYGSHQLYQSRNKKTTTASTIKVGLMMPFSGPSSAMGYATSKGVQLAKKQLGADNIEIIQADSKCDADAAKQAIQNLIAQHVVAIIGEGCSSASLAALPYADSSKTVMISPSASSPALSIPNDYFFRVVPSDIFQGSFMAQTVYNKGYRKVAIFYTNEPYGTAMESVFRQKFESLGGKVIATAVAESDSISLAQQMSTLKAANADAVFFAPNTAASAAASIKLARDIGIKVPFFGGDSFYDSTVTENAQQAAEGMTITSFPTGTVAFKQAILNEFQISDQLYAAAQAYDSFEALYLTTQKGATTNEQIKATLPGISFTGVSAHISFDKNGEISDPNYMYDLLQVKDGKFVTVN